MPALFIVNPVAGRGAGASLLTSRPPTLPADAEIVPTRGPGDASRIAEEAARAGFGPIVAVGGDGTAMETVNGLMRVASRPSLGIVPVGSGNDFARTVGIPHDADQAIQRIYSHEGDPVDVACCNDRYFLNVGGAGLDTEVARSLARSRSMLLRGQAGYVVHGVKVLSRYRNPVVTIRLDDQVITSRCLLVAVANGRYFAGGMKICPDAEVDDGMLDVCVAGDLSRAEALSQIPMIYFGRHVRHPKVQMYRSRHVRLEQ
ncbi:MAG: diacylglycerol kinase family lipid kinase, partial [Chloroflexota bacterium]|nr:diacylglycerol kinase family lipid kinase [Chloroflexota bacterium]